MVRNGSVENLFIASMSYEDFLQCWSYVSVFNWFPSKKLPALTVNVSF